MSLVTPGRITLFLVAVTLFAPYYILEQSLFEGTIIRILAPTWSFVSYSTAPFIFEFPFGFTIDNLPFWGMGLIIAAVSYSSITKNELTRLGYAIITCIFLLMQLGYFIFIGFIANNSPPISVTPIPIVALLALLMTPIIRKSPQSYR